MIFAIKQVSREKEREGEKNPALRLSLLSDYIDIDISSGVPLVLAKNRGHFPLELKSTTSRENALAMTRQELFTSME